MRRLKDRILTGLKIVEQQLVDELVGDGDLPLLILQIDLLWLLELSSLLDEFVNGIWKELVEDAVEELFFDIPQSLLFLSRWLR
jgi:hypothetical protein